MNSKKENGFSSRDLASKLKALSPKGDPWKVVIGLAREKNQELLSQQLNHLGVELDLRTFDGDEGETLPDSFDLAILEESLVTNRIVHQLIEVKQRQEPLFTPVLTLVSEKTREEIRNRYGEVTNEFLTKPIRKGTLNTRIQNLLHMRYLSEELEIKHRAVTQNAYELISIVDEEGNYLFANESHERLLSYEPEELADKQVFQLLHEEDEKTLRSKVSEFMNRFEEGKVKVGESREFEELRIADKEGNYRWVSPVVIPLSKLEGTDRFLVTSRDVTERRDAFQRVQYLNDLYRSITEIDELLVREKDFLSIMKKTRQVLLKRDHYVTVELAKFDQEEEESTYLGYRDSDQWKLGERKLHVPNCVEEAIRTLNPVVVDFPEKRCRNCDFGLCKEDDHQSIALPLASERDLAGAMVVKLKPGEVVLEEELSLLEKVTSNLAYAHGKLKAEEELKETTIGILEALSQTVEEDDEYTGGHIDRVQKHAISVGKRMELSEEKLDQLRYASELHDVGKVKVPDKILGKPGELNEDEWEEMEKHPKAGEEIVGSIPRLEEAATIIGQHQEEYDGSGYPEGLQGEEIDIGARIIAVVDAWDAMRTDRPYRDALPREVAIKELKENKGSQFDPEVVDVFLKIIGEEK